MKTVEVDSQGIEIGNSLMFVVLHTRVRSNIYECAAVFEFTQEYIHSGRRLSYITFYSLANSIVHGTY